MLYGPVSQFLWTDAEGNTHVVAQADGGEQGDPLMLGLYSVAQHGALVDADSKLLPDEKLFSFLDDLYVTCHRTRAYEAFRVVADSVQEHAGVRTHLGKLRVWCNGGGPAPEELRALGPDVWRADKPEEENGLVVLGTPLGRKAFVDAFAEERLQQEEKLLSELPLLPDLQSAWVLLSQSVVQRANHTMRILPPSLSETYAKKHDVRTWETFCKLFSAESFLGDQLAKEVSSLPGCFGGLGLSSASRTATAAYWASWVDALAVVDSKDKRFSARVLAELNDVHSLVPCISEAQTCLARVQGGGGVEAPSWEEAATGVKPPPSSEEADQTDFERGWQNYAFTFLETNFLEDVVKPTCDKSRLAFLLSQGDGAGSAWLRAVPSEKAFELSPLRLQVAVRRRLRWPLPLSKGVRCRSCLKDLDVPGDRAAACPTAGRLAKRARPVEKSWARVLREGGARVRENVELRDTTLAAVDPNDGRRVEIVASGLPLSQGVPLAVNATVVSPLHAGGLPFARAHFQRGSTFHRADKSKRDTYPELVGSSV